MMGCLFLQTLNFFVEVSAGIMLTLELNHDNPSVKQVRYSWIILAFQLTVIFLLE